MDTPGHVPSPDEVFESYPGILAFSKWWEEQEPPQLDMSVTDATDELPPTARGDLKDKTHKFCFKILESGLVIFAFREDWLQYFADHIGEYTEPELLFIDKRLGAMADEDSNIIVLP